MKNTFLCLVKCIIMIIYFKTKWFHKNFFICTFFKTYFKAAGAEKTREQHSSSRLHASHTFTFPLFLSILLSCHAIYNAFFLLVFIPMYTNTHTWHVAHIAWVTLDLTFQKTILMLFKISLFFNQFQYLLPRFTPSYI